MRKKVISLVLALVLVLGALPLTGLTARAASDSGTLGYNVLWHFNKDTGEFRVTGEGEMNKDSVLIPESLRSQVKSAVIEEGVTSIVSSVFREFTEMESIQIPESVKKIEGWAFQKCSSLKSVVIPKGVTVLDGCTFTGCSALEQVILSEGLLAINSGAFRDCTSLREVTLPDSLEGIDDRAFQNCTGLTRVALGKNVRYIDNTAFQDCTALEAFTVAAENETFDADGRGALYSQGGKKLFLLPAALTGTYEVREGTTAIGEPAFSLCGGLTDVTLPESLEHIDYHVFKDTPIYNDESRWEDGVLYLSGWVIGVRDNGSGVYHVKPGTVAIASGGFAGGLSADESTVRKVTLPEGLRLLDNGAFTYQIQLTSVSLPGTLRSIGNNAFEGCFGLKSIELPEGLVSIGDDAFANCSLIRLRIPASVTHIGERAFYTAFAMPESGDAGSRMGFTVAEGNTAFSADDRGVLFNKDKTELIQGPVNMSRDSKNPDKVNSSYTIPDTVRRIGDYAFYYCEELTSFTIPSSVESIGEMAFDWTGALHRVNSAYYQAALYISDCLIQVCDNSTFSGDYTVKAGTRLIADGAFDRCGMLDSVTLPSSLRFLGENAFANCVSLSRVEIPDRVSRIEEGAFESCWNLERVTLPTELRYIGKTAFCDTDLVSVVIPAGVKEIDDEAFLGCGKLETVDFLGDAPELGEHVFQKQLSSDMGGMPVYENLPLVTLYYRAGRSGWSTPKWNGYDTEPRDGHVHAYTYTRVAPTCTEQGYRIYVCECGDRYIADYELALGHNYRNGVCTRCGRTESGGTAPGPRPIHNPFADIEPSDYYYDAVLWAADRGITSGVNANHFAPNGTCTRAQVVSFLWRAAGKPEPSSAKNPFTDVSSEDYYYKAVLWAAEKGIVYGTSATKFSPNASCTRAQVVCFLYRYQGNPGHGTGNPFRDVKSGSYYYDAVLWAAENGVVYGTDTTHFSPDKTCTRGQVVCFLYRLLG